MDFKWGHVQYYTILKQISEDGKEVILYNAAKKIDGVLSGILVIGIFLLICTLFMIGIIITIVRKEKRI